MNTSENGVKLITSFEGFSPVQYDDGTGVMTIGYGTTAADVSPLPRHMTQPEAEHFLVKKLHDKYEPAVNNLHMPLNQNQYDALVSFCYNLGPNIFNGTKIGLHLRQRDYGGAANSMLLYDDPGTPEEQGLKRRREAERRLFLTPSDPNHYDWFFNRIVIDKHSYAERDIVKEYDRLRRHPFIHRPRLRRLRDDLSIMAGRLSTLIEEGHDPTQFHRKWRRDQMHDRSTGRRMVK